MSNSDQPPSYDEVFGSSASSHPQPHTPSAPPQPSPLDSLGPDELSELRMWFSAVDEDGDNHITAYELQQALLDEKCQPFSISTCRMLVGMFDDNANGEIELDEFVQLQRYVRKWRSIFLLYDEDDSGTIEMNELQEALSKLYMPYRFSTALCQELMRKFSPSFCTCPSLSLDNFLSVNAFVSHRLDELKASGTSGTSGTSGRSLEEFFRSSLHLM